MDAVEPLLGLVALVLVIVTLPATLELVLLTLPGLLPRKKQKDEAASQVRLAVVTPAHDEEEGLPITVKSLLACDQAIAAQDIHVVADNCSDNTAEVARRLGCSVMERQDDTLRGKGYALNFAFQRLQDKGYDGFIVVDADTTVDKNFFNAFRQLFANGADAGQSAYKVGNPQVNLRTRLMHIAFLAFNYLRPLSRHRLGLSVGILGNGFALSAATLKDIPYDSFSIVEDLEYHPRLIRAGRRVHFLEDTTVWSDMPATSEEAKSQRERWEGGRFRMIMELAPGLLKGGLSGKPRLLEPFLELILLPLTYHILLVVILLLVAKGWMFSYGLIAFGIIVLHVLIAMFVGKASMDDWKALFTAPFYMFWKLVNLTGILKAASKGASWKRTSRGD